MKIENLFFSKYKYFGALLSIILFAIPFIFSDMNKIIESILIGVGVASLSSLVISLSFDKNFMELLCEKILPFREQIKETGLDGIVYSNNMRSLNIDIVDSDELIIMMNDGKNFLSNNSTELSKRYSSKKKKTTIILLDPDSKYEEVLCQQNGKDCGVYKTKINDVIKDLNSKKLNGANIDIYLTNTMLRTHVVMTDEFIVSGTYRNSQGKDNIPPSYVYNNKGSEYTFIKHDIDKIRKSARKI